MAHRLLTLQAPTPALPWRPTHIRPQPRAVVHTPLRAQPSITVAHGNDDEALGPDDEALTDDDSSGEDSDETADVTADHVAGGARWYGGEEDEYDGLGEAAVDASYDVDMGQEGLDSDTIGVWAAVNSMAGVAPTLRSIERCFSFPLDRFQRQAVQVLLGGESCVVCAPTGAGKTAIAEAATIATLARGQRVIYTTPLKALSNQKMYEMRKLFGEDAVGLQTGDTSLRPDAHIVIMTTEILRNILYRAAEEDATRRAQGDGQPIELPLTEDLNGVAEVAPAAQQQPVAGSQLASIGLVVLDEVHYLADPNRGSVWEEVIINCPPSIQLLAMSATVRNPADLGGWIGKTVVSKDRPVPLRWHFCHKIRGATLLLPLYASNGRRLNQQLLPAEGKLLRKGGGGIRHLSELDPAWGRRDGGRSVPDSWTVDPGESPQRRIPDMDAVLQTLRTRDMLPAIWFIFSRRDCDQAAVRCAEDGIVLTTPEEQASIQQEVAALQTSQPESVKDTMVAALLAGLASHHAGCLPAWKTLVEGLFQRGLLKVVFATETLAAGINMPARCTVISSMARRRNAGVAMLTHNELLQMAGRAGRRGYDVIGHAVLLQTRFEGPKEAFGIIRGGPEPLTSQFTTGYSMVLNLLATRSLQEAKAFVQRSFSHYLGSEGSQRRLDEIAVLEASARALLVPGSAGKKRGGKAGPDPDAADLERFTKLSERRRAERRQLRLLQAQVGRARSDVLLQQLMEQHGPCVVKLDMSTAVLSSVDEADGMPALCFGLVTDDATKGEPWCLCFSSDNRVLKVGPQLVQSIAPLPTVPDESIATLLRSTIALETISQRVATLAAALPGAWTRVDPAMWSLDGTVAMAKAALQLSDESSALAFERVDVPAELQEAITAQRARLSEAKRELRALSRATTGTASGARKAASGAAKAARMLEEAKQLRAELDASLNTTWAGFEAVVGVLQDAGALAPETLQCLPLGHVARQLNGENELWMATAFSHAAVQSLSPAGLAGVACALVTPSMVSKPTVWVAYPPSQQVVVALEALQEAQDMLFGLQARHGVLASLSVDLRLAGLVEAWAAGCTWDQLMTDCSLDDGDVARVLSRSVDVLKQVSFVGQLPEATRLAARRAVNVMDRTPISDLVM